MTQHTLSAELSERKQHIAQHFSKAKYYDQYATIQQRTCQQLCEQIEITNPHSILEVGAGTGQLTRLLTQHIQPTHWVINELCEDQAKGLHAILPQALIVIGDAETIPLDADLNAGSNASSSLNKSTGYDLIVSANAVQWFDNPLKFVTQSFKRLNSGGQLLFNTFTPNNFIQIKTLTGQGLDYPTIDNWHTALKQTGFDHIKLTIHRYDVEFKKPYDVLKHMKHTGVSTNQTRIHQNKNAEQPPFVWTKSTLKQFEDAYWAQYCTQTDDDINRRVYLTYEVLIISAIKP